MTARSLKNLVMTQSIAVVCFLLVPIVITLVAPVSRLDFRRSETEVAVTVVRYVLLVIPWKTERISGVTQIRPDIQTESTHRRTNRSRGRTETVTQLATGQVAIVSGGTEVIVQAAPDLAKQIAREFDEFLANEAAHPRSISVYASWPLSYLLGGAATAFSALYVLGALLAVVTFPLRLLRSLRRGVTPMDPRTSRID